jgi:hypothetical protein
METVELRLDKETLERACVIAQTQARSSEKLIAEIIPHLEPPKLTSDPVLGVFARDSELINQVVQVVGSAMQSREIP